MIRVRNWERFQHADTTKRGRTPAWIKLYTGLLSDENYLGLTPRRRALLIGIWMEYARSGGELPADTASLTRRLGLTVTARDLASLRDSGFIEYDSDPRSAGARRAHASRTVSARLAHGPRSRGAREPFAPPTEPPNRAAQDGFRHDTVTPPSSLEERREEHGPRDRSPTAEPEEDVAREEPIDELAQRRRQQGMTINGRPVQEGELIGRFEPPRFEPPDPSELIVARAQPP